jgi:ribosomal-protein-alanine N-acetyltransferase
MISFPEVVVDRWRLRPLRLEDAEPWLAIVLDPELRRLTSWGIETLEEMRRNLAAYVEGPKAATTRRWAIVDEQGTFCGTCGLKDWDRAAGSAELTYELGREHRGRGTMTTIAQAVVTHGFQDMQLQVIHALVMVDNTASNRLLAKLGFQRTATLPSFRSCGGVSRDFYRYERRANGDRLLHREPERPATGREGGS